MTNKLKFLTGVSLKRKIKTKWFLAANIILAILIVAVANIDSVIKFFGGDFDKKTEFYVIDNTNMTFEPLKEMLVNTSKQVYDKNEYKVKLYNKSEKKLKEKIKNQDKKIGIVVDDDLENVIKVKVISNGYIEMLD